MMVRDASHKLAGYYIVFELLGLISVGKPYMEGKSDAFKLSNAASPGYTDPNDWGNTQTGTFQISSVNTFWWPEDEINLKNN